MKWTYPEALKRLLVHEGGYGNHPSDPGGPTNFGITIADYRRYIKKSGTALDVKNMTRAEAAMIYKMRYADPQKYDETPAGLDYTLFDYGVNSGIGRSGKVIRRVMGMADNTSVVTTEVMAQIGKRDPKQLIAAVNDERLRFLKQLRTWSVFGKGWGSRVSGVKSVSLRMAKETGPVDQTVTTPVETTGRAKAEVTSPKVAKNIVGTASGVSTGGTGFWYIDWVIAHPIYSVAIVAGVIVAVVVVFKLLNANFKKRQEAPVAGITIVPPEGI